jgi:hypothetical protein
LKCISCPRPLALSLSASWPPWGEQPLPLAPATMFLSNLRLETTEPANHVMKLWAKQIFPPFSCFSQVFVTMTKNYCTISVV